MNTIQAAIAEIVAEALRDAANELSDLAALEFDAKGPHDPRGAAIWDCASRLTHRADRVAAGLTP